MDISRQKPQPLVHQVNFGASGKLWDLGGIAAVLQAKALDYGMSIQTYAPNTVKLYATSKGSGDKLRIFQKFMTEDTPLTREILSYFPPNPTPKTDILNDLIDAWYIAELLLTEVRLRKGMIRLQNLPEWVIQIFNAVRGKDKVNILGREMLRKL